MSRSNIPPLPVGRVLRKGLAGFRTGGGALLARAGVMMAVPAAVLLARLATDGYWTNLALWILALVVAGYAAWPVSRTALAAVSPGVPTPPSPDDLWVRDGFVRGSAVCFLTVAVGTVFFVVPGIMVLMIYSLYPFLIVERKASGFPALAQSSQLTSGNRIRLLGVVLACAVLFAPGLTAFYAGNQGLAAIIALWLLGTPALAIGFTCVAAAYRELAHR
ncbi:MAG: hypothetical protein F4Y40_10350 [Acidimicrobiia bacterium]|nr:hypothetical protein [Acidimicrobiia bacterium]